MILKSLSLVLSSFSAHFNAVAFLKINKICPAEKEQRNISRNAKSIRHSSDNNLKAFINLLPISSFSINES